MDYIKELQVIVPETMLAWIREMRSGSGEHGILFCDLYLHCLMTTKVPEFLANMSKIYPFLLEEPVHRVHSLHLRLRCGGQTGCARWVHPDVRAPWRPSPDSSLPLLFSDMTSQSNKTF
ncbi:hypothetical protein ACJJTC_010352 [Scirpophaga incertulas]